MQKFKIMSLKRLIQASASLGNSTHVMEQQTARTQNRLNQGVDLDGATFKPYKDQTRAHPNSRPLEHASRLFESPHYDLTKTLSGCEIRMTITGEAARIARYQNVKRRFIGFARSDRGDVRQEMKHMLVEAFRNAQ